MGTCLLVAVQEAVDCKLPGALAGLPGPHPRVHPALAWVPAPSSYSSAPPRWRLLYQQVCALGRNGTSSEPGLVSDQGRSRCCQPLWHMRSAGSGASSKEIAIVKASIRAHLGGVGAAQ